MERYAEYQREVAFWLEAKTIKDASSLVLLKIIAALANGYVDRSMAACEAD